MLLSSWGQVHAEDSVVHGYVPSLFLSFSRPL